MARLHRIVISLVAFSIASLYPTVRAQQAQASSDPIAKLLEVPAPLPDSANDSFDPWENKAKSPPIPGEDAPLDLLVKYWRVTFRYNAPPPSDRVRRRLLEAVERYPDELSRLVDGLPDTPESHDRVKALLDQMPPPDEKDEESDASYRCFHARARPARNPVRQHADVGR